MLGPTVAPARHVALCFGAAHDVAGELSLDTAVLGPRESMAGRGRRWIGWEVVGWLWRMFIPIGFAGEVAAGGKARKGTRHRKLHRATTSQQCHRRNADGSHPPS